MFSMKFPWDLNVFDEISIRYNYNGKYLHGVESSGYETSWEVTSSAKLLGLKMTSRSYWPLPTSLVWPALEVVFFLRNRILLLVLAVNWLPSLNRHLPCPNLGILLPVPFRSTVTLSFAHPTGRP